VLFARRLKRAVSFGVCAAALALGACGGRTTLIDVGAAARDAGADVRTDARPIEAGPVCTAPDGVRLCGHGCAWLAAPECAGLGCVEAVDRNTGAKTGEGVCMSDMPDQGKEPCWDCPDGDTCLELQGQGLVCVPEAVCRALWNTGVRDVCRDADKHAYDGRAIPTWTKSCPSPYTPLSHYYLMCSGSCGGCTPGASCSGRSPDHPLGVCVPENGQDGSPCTVQPGVGHDCGALGLDDCAVYNVPQADESAALEYGFCSTDADCKDLAKLLPGGITCYDRSGHVVAK
jgi:hypothetical protein